MKFEIGNKVKVKNEVLKRMRPRTSARLSGVGTVTMDGLKYVQVVFPNSINGHWLTYRALELVKNQLRPPKNTQLLFKFYTE